MLKFASLLVGYRTTEVHWYEAYSIGKKAKSLFAVCVDNSGYSASLELYKIYPVLLDDDATADGDLHIINESGEDYLYSADRFVLIDLPQK